MGRKIRLTESQLRRIIESTINELSPETYGKVMGIRQAQYWDAQQNGRPADAKYYSTINRRNNDNFDAIRNQRRIQQAGGINQYSDMIQKADDYRKGNFEGEKDARAAKRASDKFNNLKADEEKWNNDSGQAFQKAYKDYMDKK